jgi:hypothetical protein
VNLRARKLALLVAAATAALAVAEVGLGIAASRSPALRYLLAREQIRLLPDERLGHRPHPHYPDHDQRGFRNDSVPRHPPCLVALGDSQTYGHHVQRDEAWPQAVTRIAGISSYNMAFGGWGPGQALYLLDQALAMEPRIVAYGLYTGNDLYDSFHAAYGLGTLAHLATTDQARHRRLALAPPPDFDQFLPGREPRLERHGAGRAWLARRSQLYGLLRAARRARLERGRRASDPFGSDDWQAVRAVTGDRERFFPVDRPPVRTVFTPAWRTLALDRGDDAIAEGYRVTVDALDEMRRRVSSRSARFVVVLIPTKETVYAPWVAAGEDPRYDRLTRLEQAVIEDLERDLARRGVEVIDVLPALRRSVETGEAPYRISADGHKSHAGHRHVAEAVVAAFVGEDGASFSACASAPSPGAGR